MSRLNRNLVTDQLEMGFSGSGMHPRGPSSSEQEDRLRNFIERVRHADLPLWVQGMTLSDWIRMTRTYGRPRRGKPFFAKATLLAARNSLQRLREQQRFSTQIDETEIPPPVFVLGFWRSGTTHLHNLLTVDDRFASPNHFEVCNPFSFLSTEDQARQRYGDDPLKTRPQDNVLAGLFTAAEDEFALAAMTQMSPLLGSLYPAAVQIHSKYLTFHDTTKSEQQEWKQALEFFVRKLTLKYDRPMVLKSPAHTARVHMLLELFPNARFVHISRHPHDIFPSYENMLMKYEGSWALEYKDAWRAFIIHRFAEMYECFFEERAQIPADRYTEVKFEDLEAKPLETMQSIYHALDLPDFSYVSQGITDYVSTLKNYQKNKYSQLDRELTEQLYEAWRSYFDEWGYTSQTPDIRDTPSV